MSNENYVLEFSLNFEHKEITHWNKIFKIAWQCYSCLFDEIQPILKEHSKDKFLNLKELKLREYDLHSRIVKYKKNYETYLWIHICQKIATQISTWISNYCFWNWKEITKKKEFQFTSIEWKTNATGIRVIKIKWDYYFSYKWFLKKLSFKDDYQLENFNFEKIAYCRVVRKQFRRNYNYYLQLVMKWSSSKKKKISKMRAWCDFWLNAIALVREDNQCKLFHTWEWNYHQERIARLQKIISQEYVSLNPDCYDEDWKFKEWVKLKANWKIAYLMKIINCLRRKQAKKHKDEINILVKEILAFAWDLISEEMDFKEIKKSKEYRSLWKIIQFCTPWLLKSKLEENIELKFVDKYNYRASQYNHLTDTYIKPLLSERTKKIWENIIQRDLYSAYLLLNHNEDLKTIDRKKCIDNFNTFLINHNQLISTLKQSWLTYPKSFWLDNF